MTEIVREEMDATGALEVDLPILQPKELWVESGRWDRYQAEGILFHLKDRKEGEFALAPTAEEAVTDMVRRSVLVYQAYVRQNRQQFMFISSERSGGSRLLRMAIRTDVTHFTNEMAQDFRRLGLYQDLPTASLQMVCGLIVTSMLAAAADILDLPPAYSKDIAARPQVKITIAPPVTAKP